MKMDETLLKRIVAFLLTLALVFTSGDFVPVIATAIAEGETAASTEEQSELVLPAPEESAPLDAEPTGQEESDDAAETGLQETAAQETAEQAGQEAAEQAVQEQAEQEAAEEAVQEQAAQEAAEQAVQEQAEQEAAEEAVQEQAAQEATEEAAQEQAEQEVAEQAAEEQAAQEAAEKAAQEQAAQEAAEKAAEEQAAQEAAEKAAQEAAEKAAQEQAAQEATYQEAYDRIINNINVIEAMARALSIDQTALMAYRLAKGMLPLTYMNTLVTRTVPITKARYGDEENEAVDQVFVMDVKGMLEKDVRIAKDQLAPYQMWVNNATFHSVYMLPNAAQLYIDSADGLDYITDIVQGDVLNDGFTYDLEIITALNENAYANPELPIGRTGRLNFATGVLTIPSYTDFELYLHEISAAWLIEKIESGYIRTLMGDQDEINAIALDGSKNLPKGTIVEGLTDGGSVEGIRLYWIGGTPETAADPDQTLILLMVNEKTDEVDAFRTTVNMLNENAPLIDLSIYLFRDSESDRKEQEKYDAFWFDSFDEDLSLVKVLTNVVGGKLEVPRPIRITLRPYSMEGIGLPVYSLVDKLFLMCDGTQGTVSLFGDAYHATFDGDTFESNYTLVEGIAAGDIVVTIKKGQPVWPEWTGEDEAEDIGGQKYKLVDGQWVELEQEPGIQANNASPDAA